METADSPSTQSESTTGPAQTNSEASDVVTPTEANNWLIAAGVLDVVWDKYLERHLGSPELRSFIIVAKGTEPKSLREVYDALRAEDGQPPADETMRQRLLQHVAYAKNPI